MTGDRPVDVTRLDRFLVGGERITPLSNAGINPVPPVNERVLMSVARAASSGSRNYVELKVLSSDAVPLTGKA